MDLGTLLEVLLRAASSGGTGAAISICVLFGIVGWYGVRYVLRDKESQLRELKEQLKDKELDLKDRTAKFEDVIQKYHSGTITITEAFQKVENLLHEIKGMMGGRR